MKKRFARRSAALTALLGLVAAAAVGFAPAATAAPSVREQQWWLSVWQMDDVWKISKGKDITVALVEEGVDASIPELADAVLPGVELSGDAGDGRIDKSPDGHGTMMATMIAARGTGGGFIGIAPEAKILPVSIAGVPSSERFQKAIRWAADHGAKVINVSQAQRALKGDCDPDLQAAVAYAIGKDAVVVAGAGNLPDGQAFAPAACPGVISVGAISKDTKVWEKSHRDKYVDVVAPGVGMVGVGRAGKQTFTDGTSDATALVSGAIAVVRSQFKTLTGREIVTKILNSLHHLNAAGRDDASGDGIVLPYFALTKTIAPTATNAVYDDFDAQPKVKTSDSATPAAAKSSGSGLKPGTIVSIIGVVVGLLIVLLVVFVIVRIVRGKKRRAAAQAPSGGFGPGAPPQFGPPPGFGPGQHQQFPPPPDYGPGQQFPPAPGQQPPRA